MDKESTETCLINVDSRDGLQPLVHEIQVSRYRGEDSAWREGRVVYQVQVRPNHFDNGNSGAIRLQPSVSTSEELPGPRQSAADHVVLGEGLWTLGYTALDEIERQVCILIVREICLHLTLPTPRVCLILSTNLF